MSARATRHARRHALALCLALYGVSATAPAAAGPAAPALRVQVEVDAPVVSVTDVLAAVHRRSAMGTIAAKSALWAAPPPCRSVTVSIGEVVARLRELGVASDVGRGDAGESIVLHRVCHRIVPSELEAAARQALAAWLAGKAERFDIEAIGSLPALELPGRAATLVARPLETGHVLAPRMQIWVDAIDGDRVMRTLPVSFVVHAYGQAWVSSRDAHIDEFLRGAGLMRQEVDLAAVRGEAVKADLGNVRLRRPLLAGDVLTVAHLATEGVRTGTKVTARSRFGAIDIEASAQAVQDGRIGQTVWVRVAGATAPVRARVIDQAMVEVERE